MRRLKFVSSEQAGAYADRPLPMQVNRELRASVDNLSRAIGFLLLEDEMLVD